MKKQLQRFAFAFSATIFFSFSSSAQLKVVIIRHGEKPPSGDNLSCQGFNRSKLLPPVLYKACGGVPNYTFVPTMKTGKSTSSVRMFQTVTPFAVQYNLKIDTKYAETDTIKAAAEVIKKTGVVLMVWEHGNIPGLARNMGVADVPGWKGSDFDSIWTIEFPAGGGTPTLTIGQEGLKPSGICK